MPQNVSSATAEPSTDIQASASPEEATSERNSLSAIFNNVMTLCAMLPLLLFTCLNSFLHQRWAQPLHLLHPTVPGLPALTTPCLSLCRIPQSVRILGSLVAILLVFLVTAILVKVQMDPLPFFVLTMIKIMLINCRLGRAGRTLRAVTTQTPEKPGPGPSRLLGSLADTYPVYPQHSVPSCKGVSSALLASCLSATQPPS